MVVLNLDGATGTAPEIKQFGRIAKRQVSIGEKWHSEGFAEAEKKDNKRPPVGIKGELNNNGHHDTYDLGVDYSTKQDEHWRGISGGAVFSGYESNDIIGIIVSCRANYGAQRLNATPTFKLLEQESFRRIVYAEIDVEAEKREKLAWAAKEIEQLLDHANVLKRLSVELKAGADAATITDTLLHLPLPRLLNVLNTMRVDFQKAAELSSLECTRKIFNVLLPALFDCHLTALARRHKETFVEVSLNPAIATESVAEIIMAGADDRGTVFILEKPNALPFGAFNRHKSLPLPGKIEIGPDKKQTHLECFHRQMIDEFAVSSGAIEPDLIEDAADEIEHLATRTYDKQTRYCTYTLPEAADERAVLREVIESLQRDYRYLVFIELTSDRNLRRNEQKQVRPIRDMLDVNKQNK